MKSNFFTLFEVLNDGRPVYYNREMRDEDIAAMFGKFYNGPIIEEAAQNYSEFKMRMEKEKDLFDRTTNLKKDFQTIRERFEGHEFETKMPEGMDNTSFQDFKKLWRESGYAEGHGPYGKIYSGVWEQTITKKRFFLAREKWEWKIVTSVMEQYRDKHEILEELIYVG